MRLVLFCVVLLSMIGCSQPNKVISREGEPDVVMVDADDAEMKAATEKTRNTLDTFIARLAKKKADEEFGLKVALKTPDDSVENIWLDDVAYKDGSFTGTIGNEPINLPEYKFGSPVTVPRDKVCDWLIAKAGKFEGGHTVDVLSKREGTEAIPR